MVVVSPLLQQRHKLVQSWPSPILEFQEVIGLFRIESFLHGNPLCRKSVISFVLKHLLDKNFTRRYFSKFLTKPQTQFFSWRCDLIFTSPGPASMAMWLSIHWSKPHKGPIMFSSCTLLMKISRSSDSQPGLVGTPDQNWRCT